MDTIKEAHEKLNKFNDTTPIGSLVTFKPHAYTPSIHTETESMAIMCAAEPVVFVKDCAFPVRLSSITKI